ncbi:MAG: hypothetical protein ACPIOQ_45905 [Promethearchaeia archaeon]
MPKQACNITTKEKVHDRRRRNACVLMGFIKGCKGAGESPLLLPSYHMDSTLITHSTQLRCALQMTFYCSTQDRTSEEFPPWGEAEADTSCG